MAERQIHLPDSAVDRAAADARLRQEIEHLRTENEQLRTVLRQVRGHTITREAKRLIDAATRRG